MPWFVARFEFWVPRKRPKKGRASMRRIARYTFKAKDIWKARAKARKEAYENGWRMLGVHEKR